MHHYKLLLNTNHNSLKKNLLEFKEMVFKNGVKNIMLRMVYCWKLNFCMSSLHFKDSDESLIDFLSMINSYCLFWWNLLTSTVYNIKIVLPVKKIEMIRNTINISIFITVNIKKSTKYCARAYCSTYDDSLQKTLVQWKFHPYTMNSTNHKTAGLHFFDWLKY